ncbi:MAG: hypothetical protein IPP15_16040 [Saprospiraceae bacterium]|uniref:Uncharacterized protein n=1 Tax=Candidatus Opimibacter skivensis TaxID=2982028 RepID=A0A9D7SV94_9BACT|nr:hypothetical protein [Candidatus Opimibacter skivensis]
MKDISSGLWILEKKKPVPDPCAGTLSILNDGCGHLTAVVTGGGPGPFTFAWTGPGGFTSNAPSISPILAGTYNVGRVNCRDVVSAPFTPPQPLHFCACVDNADKFPRMLTLTEFSGGSGAYEYSKDGGAWNPVTLPTTSIGIVAVPLNEIITIEIRDANCPGLAHVLKTLYCPNASFDFNNALEFDGVNDYIETSALVGTPIPATGTIVAWIKNGETPDYGGQEHGEDSANAGGNRGMIWTGDVLQSNQNTAFSLRMNAGLIQAHIGTGSPFVQLSIKPPFLDSDFRGGWMMVAMTWVRGAGNVYTYKLYVGDDNSNTWLPYASGTSNPYPNANFTAFNWGAITHWDPTKDARTYPFYGFMDELRYFNRELEECELRCLFNQGSGNNALDLDTNLRVYYKLDETGGNNAQNYGTGGGALNGLLRGFSGLDGANDTTWRTAFGSGEAFRPHAAGPHGVDYPALSFLGFDETVNLRYYINNGDSVSIFTELEFHSPAPPNTPLPRALFGVFRPMNSQMHGQSISQIENCATPVHPWDCGIFDARFNEATGRLTVQIANLNDVLGTSPFAILPNWQNRKIGLAFVVDAATKNLKVFYNDGGGGATTVIINVTYDDVNPQVDGNIYQMSSMFYGGALLFGSPCPFVTDYPGGPCGGNGLKSQAMNLYDLHVYNAPLVQGDFDGWFNEALGVTTVGAHNIRNERSLLAAPVQRRFRPLLKPGDYTALIDTGPLATDGLLHKSVNSFFNITHTGPDTGLCAFPASYTATFIPYVAVPGWLNSREIPTGTAWIID